jgi:hypothetical protein
MPRATVGEWIGSPFYTPTNDHDLCRCFLFSSRFLGDHDQAFNVISRAAKPMRISPVTTLTTRHTTGCPRSALMRSMLRTTQLNHAAALVVIAPGPATFLLLRNTPVQGRRAGLFNTAGIVAAVLSHATLSMMGLSAIVLTSNTLFQIIKIAAAAYLSYLGFLACKGSYRGERETGLIADHCSGLPSARRRTGGCEAPKARSPLPPGLA